MKVLGIETSCDETGVAIYDDEQGLIAQALYSQIKMHAEYGGVVPELASRDHVRKLLPLVDEVLKEANLKGTDLDGVAYTAGPGLMGALFVGAATGRSLAWSWDIPGVPVHHMEGHLLAPMLDDPKPEFPFVALLVSGGHTQLIEVKNIGEYTILGESVDDAAGEAFDKTAKLLGLPYPGGPELAKLAESGNVSRYKFPRPMCDRPGLDFSFSGLKTFALNTFIKDCKDLEKGSDEWAQTRADIACAFQNAVVDTLAIKCKRALKETGHSRLVVAGGVSANTELRRQLAELAQKIGGEVFYPQPAYCTDNGAMIAYAGMQRLKAGQIADTQVICQPRWPLDQLPSVND